MNDEVAEWTGFFNEVFSEARERILRQYKLEEDGSGWFDTFVGRMAVEALTPYFQSRAKLKGLSPLFPCTSGT